jgi:Uma2 family endonuclease
VSLLVEPHRVWTFADLDAWLPEYDDAGNQIDWRRFEILDGALVVSPSAAPRHEITTMRLAAALQPSVPSGYEVVGALGIDLGDTTYLVPDLVVVPTRIYFGEAKIVQPADALLAVEVVSPSSHTMDRITKPARYAQAGVRAFWRVETDPDVSLTAYSLPTGADHYDELGTWTRGQVAEIDQPFAARIEIDALAPSH